MLWLQPLPWGRWALVVLVALAALYIEFRPDPTADVLFATRDIQPGDTLDATNTEPRPVPSGLIVGAGHGDIAGRPVSTGDPVLESGVSATNQIVPAGWWVVGVTLPDGARTGDAVRLVLLDTGKEVEGIVAHPGSDDPFAAADGGVAVPTETSGEVALAAANGRLAVLISTG
jgi:hypothetical protein